MNSTSKQKLIILCGESFSGKSTLSKKLAETLNIPIIGRDDIYFAIEQSLELESTPDEDDDAIWRGALWQLLIQGVKNKLLLGDSVIIDDNCFYVEQRNELRSIASKAGVNTVLIFVDTPFEVLRERKLQNKLNKTRHDVPSEWMETDTHKFERPTESENPIIFTPNDSLELLLGRISDTNK